MPTSSDLLSRLDLLEARVHDLERIRRPSFRAAQYNILASYLGNNTEPWFLYGGLTDSKGDKERADQIAKKHIEKDAEGKYVNVGWPNYVKGILTDEEIAAVERRNKEVFSWDIRGPRIIETIREIDADVLSLVELDQYEDYFRPELEKMGMGSVWAKRPRKSSMDGCGICWRKTKFDLLVHESFAFSDNLEGTRKDRVALMTLLKMKFTPNDPRVIFVSVHLARNPECRNQEAIRLRQAAQLMSKLKSFADQYECGSDVPVVVAGDWNAESLDEIRSVTSALYGLRGMISSVHPLLLGSTDVPTPRTSFTLLRQSRIDYLMYSENSLRLIRMSPYTTMAEAQRKMMIPNEEHPSDHLPISADFEYPTELERAEHNARRFCMAVMYHMALRALLPDEIRLAFKYFDRDGSGSISADELSAGVQRLGIHMTTESKKRLLAAFCTSRRRMSGDLGEEATIETFKKAFEDHFQSGFEDLDSPFIQDIKRAFCFFDTNGDGSLTRDELTTTLRSISPTPIDDDEMEIIMLTVDANRDGDISLDEFVKTFVRSHKKLMQKRLSMRSSMKTYM